MSLRAQFPTGPSGVGPGDVVATSPLSFAASAACALYAGATPAFVDIDPGTLCLDTTKVPPGIAAIVAVHYAGYPMDLDFGARRPPPPREGLRYHSRRPLHPTLR